MKSFLEVTVPQGFNMLPEDLRQQASGDEVMQIELEGDGGGVWHFRIQNGQMSVGQGAAEKWTVILATTVDGFREMIEGRLKPEGSQSDIGKMMGRMFDPKKRNALNSLKGTFKARYCEGQMPDESKVAVETYFAFGGEAVNRASPRMTILMPMETFVGLQTGKLQGPQVFMQGGMRLTGDMSMAMQMQALLV